MAISYYRVRVLNPSFDPVKLSGRTSVDGRKCNPRQGSAVDDEILTEENRTTQRRSRIARRLAKGESR